MPSVSSLDNHKKLAVTYRVESGCLGSSGASLVDDFCAYAQQEIQGLDANYVVWMITPRTDKALPEMQYQVLGKRMNHDQVGRYLQLFNKSLDEFESHLIEKLTQLIHQFMHK
jgi:hypothetical protein